MSSRREASAPGGDFSAEGGERSNVYTGGTLAPSLVTDPVPPRREGEQEGLPGSQGREFDSDAELEMIEAGRAVFWIGEESSSSVEETGSSQSSLPDFDIEGAVMQHPTNPVARGTLRLPMRERGTTTVSTTWAEVASCFRGRGPRIRSGRGALVPSGRGALVHSGRGALVPGGRGAPVSSGKGVQGGRGTLVSGGRVMLLTSGRGTLSSSHAGAQQASTTTPHSSSPEPGRAWEKRGSEVSQTVIQGAKSPSSDIEISEESSELPPMRVTISLKRGDQAKLDNPKESEDTAENSSGEDQEISDTTPGSLAVPSQELSTNRETQAAEEQEASSSKKKQTVVRAKGGNKPSYSVAAATGNLPRGHHRKRMTHEKKFPESDSSVTLGRIFPPWGQRIKAPSLEAASLPPISCVPVFGSSKSSSSLIPGPKQSKQGSTVRRSRTWRRRETQSAAREDYELNTDPVLQAQISTQRSGPSYLSLHRGESISSDAHARAPHISEKSQPLPQRQEVITPRGFDDQEPPMQPIVPERPQQPLGEQGCPRCPVLLKEIEKLKDQLAAIQFLKEKFPSFEI